MRITYDGEPIGTKYGLRVVVVGLPASLKVVGPAAFGYDVPFLPLPGDLL